MVLKAMSVAGLRVCSSSSENDFLPLSVPSSSPLAQKNAIGCLKLLVSSLGEEMWLSAVS